MFWKSYPDWGQSCTYGEATYSVCTCNVRKKRSHQSNVFVKVSDQWPASLLRISFY